MKKIVSLLIAFIITVQPINVYVTNAVENEDIAQSYENKFVPADGKTLVFIGQDDDEVADYIEATGETPAGMMIYTNLGDLSAMTTQYQGTGANQSGKMDFQAWTTKFENTALNLAIWASSTNVLNSIANGDYDDNIKKLASYMKSSDKPIYVRFGYEFDGPWNAYTPSLYIQAYKHFVDVIRDTTIPGEYHYGAGNNISFVWHSAAFFRLGENNIWPEINYDAESVENYLTNPTYTLEDWYPGDEYVDWVGISYFSWELDFQERAASLRRDEAVSFAKEHNKPVMIAESAPKENAQKGDTWNNWYKPLFDYIEANDIKAFCYINQDWNAQEMWRLEGGWGDSRVQENEELLAKWLEKLSEERYLTSSDNIYNEIGFTPSNKTQNLTDKIIATKYSSKAHNGEGWGITDYDTYISFNGQYTWAEYNVNVEKPGYYKVVYDYISGLSNGATINVLVNGVQQDVTATLPFTDSSWSKNAIVEGQTIYLEYPGRYTILFQSPSAGLNLNKVTFQETEPVQSTGKVHLHGKDDISSESTNMTLTYGSFASFGAPSKAIYYFDIAKEGDYQITYNYGTTVNSKYKFYVDDVLVEDSMFTATGDWTRWVDKSGPMVHLAPGKHKVTLESPNGNLNIQYLELTLIENAPEETTTITPSAEENTTTSNIEDSTQAVGKPKKIKKVSVKLINIRESKKTIKVKWKKVNKADGYQIQYARNRKFTKGVKSVYAKKNSKKVKVPKKICYVRVRSFVKENGVKVFGEYSKIKKIK